MLGGEDLGYLWRVKRGADRAVGAGIDNGGRAAGLSDDASAGQFFFHKSLHTHLIFRYI